MAEVGDAPKILLVYGFKFCWYRLNQRFVFLNGASENWREDEGGKKAKIKPYKCF